METQSAQSEKFESARALRDSLRFNELRQKRGIDRTAEEAREYARLYSRSRRKAIREGEGSKALKVNKQVLANIKDVESLWAHNRSMTDGKVIHRYLQMQEGYLDEIYWSNCGWQVPPDDEDFVSLEDGIACMDAFIAERGMIHDDNFNSPFLQDFRPHWGVWLSKADYVDAIWGRVLPYWRDERFHELCKESEATMIYAKFGIRTALPQYHVRLWRGRISAHKHCRTQGLEHNDPKCWLCNHERLHGAKEKQSEKTTHDNA